MTRLYTTQELAQILAQEREACLRGDRLNLTTPTPRVNPVVDTFVNVEGVQKFKAFCDFREAVHAYQRSHDVSGLLWRTFEVKSQSICFPEVDEHLIALPQDLEILATYKTAIFIYWQQAAQGMDLYRQQLKPIPAEPTTSIQAELDACQAQWAYLHKLEYAEALEITVQLGWGNPKEALYQKNWPESGCCFIHAVEPGQRLRSAYY
jgi:hypothetical protein